MNLTPEQLERVVREVVARLGTLPAETESSSRAPYRAQADKQPLPSPLAGEGPGVRGPIEKALADKQPVAPQRALADKQPVAPQRALADKQPVAPQRALADKQPVAPGVTAISEQVITLDVLGRRLNGAKSVTIAPTSVITPAARDYLRERGIAIERTSQQATAHARLEPAAILFGEAETAFNPSPLLADLARHQVRIERLARTGLVQVVDELADGVARGGACGVLLTDESAAALCLANRHRGVRACLATSREAIARAQQTIAANLLVVAPEGRGFWELRRLVREFIAAGPGQWVAAYQQRLA